MYCNKCGRAVRYGDVYCSYCGNKLDSTIYATNDIEEIVFNTSSSRQEERPFEDSNRQEEQYQSHKRPQLLGELAKTEKAVDSTFSWDVQEFTEKEKKKRANVVVDWQKLKIYDLDEMTEETAVSSENSQEQMAIQEEQQLPASQDNTNIEDLEQQPSKIDALDLENGNNPWRAAVRMTSDKTLTIEDIQKDIDDESEIARQNTDIIDKFYTFNQKNEEFQKLLDREYERVNKSKEDKLGADQTNFEALELKSQNQMFTELMEEEEDIKIYDTRELQKDIMEISSKKAADGIIKNAGQEIDNKGLIVEDLKNDQSEKISDEHNQENTMKVLEQFYEDSNNYKEANCEVEPQDNQNSEICNENNDEIYGEILSVSKDENKTEKILETETNSGTESFDEINSFDEEENKEQRGEQLTAFESDQDIQKILEDWISLDDKDTNEFNQEVQSDTVKSKNKADNFYKEKSTEKEYSDYDLEYDGKSRSNTKSIILTILLAIVIVVLMFEIVLLGLRYFAPESDITKKLNAGVEKVVSVFIKDSDIQQEEKNMEKDNSSDVNDDGASENQTILTSAEPLTMEELIFNSYKSNKNIKKIQGDATLGYNSNVNYTPSEINKSVPITNNLLYMDSDGNAVLIDQSVVNTLVAFDSKWIDYVNNKDEAVFNLLKKDSNAYKNCKSFSKAGKVKKDFNSLSIGEIRVGANGYYIWAVEEIETTEKGKTTSSTFHWIYCMETVGEEILITDYYRF